MVSHAQGAGVYSTAPYRGESVGPKPLRLEVVPLCLLEVVEVDHVRLARVVAQHLRRPAPPRPAPPRNGRPNGRALNVT